MARDAAALAGVLPPIPTPFDGAGAFSRDRLLDNLRSWNEQPLAGYVVLGSNGEGVLLSFDERVAVLEAARDVIPGERWMIAGTGCQSTPETIELTVRAARIGADAALVLPPSYYRGRMTKDALVRHFSAIGDASDIPVLIYNMPACTGIDLDAETVIALAAHPNVVGLKDSGGNVAKLGAIREALGPRFRIFAGSAGFLLPALTVGANGGILALANIAAAQCAAIYAGFAGGNLDAARELQIRLIPANTVVTTRWGVAGLKAAMDMLGLYGGPVRAPLVPLNEAELRELRAILERAGVVKARGR